ncbi:MAG: putative Ig domain-containing protein [Pseudomonadota bacterium]|nr:putative Ig domain-containing protein [Pseudomonadota bacterium]
MNIYITARAGVVLAIVFALISCGGGSSSGSGNDDSDRTSQVAAVTAISDFEVIESSIVALEATHTLDATNVISIEWTQLNGSPVLLSNAGTLTPSFTAPAVYQNYKLSFQVTITDHNNDAYADSTTVTIRPAPGILVGQPSGHTGSPGSKAYFDVLLASEPARNVTIPVRSSNTNEGEANVDAVVFTTSNWDIAQTIEVVGTNAGLNNGTQDYQIILGEAQSDDALYADLDPVAVPMQGYSLDIEPPALFDWPSGLTSSALPSALYSGHGVLEFSAPVKPSGMDIESTTGEIHWLPDASDEGGEFPVTIAVTDGTLVAEVSFSVKVSTSVPIEISFASDKLTIVDPDSDLMGSTFEILDNGLNSGSLGLTGIRSLPLSGIPDLPSGITTLSQPFIVQDSYQGELGVSIPLNFPTENLEEKQPVLLTYTQSGHSEGGIWLPASLNRHIEISGPDAKLYLSMTNTNGLYVVALLQPSAVASPLRDPVATARSLNAVPRTANKYTDITCIDREAPLLSFEYEGWVCSKIGVDKEVRVSGFSSLQDTRWQSGNNVDSANIEDVAKWAFDAIGVISDPQLFSMGIEGHIYIDVADNKSLLGYSIEWKNDLGAYAPSVVNPSGKIYLNNNGSIGASLMRSTLAHELFHRAQDLTYPMSPNPWSNERDWLEESGARWFEDFIYDDLDVYIKSFRYLLGRTLQHGLSSNIESGDSSSRSQPYARFLFHKMLNAKCDSYLSNYRNLLLPASSSDDDGVQRLSQLLTESRLQCNFFFDDYAQIDQSLGSALAYYEFAAHHPDFNTIQSLNMLDKQGNESGARDGRPFTIFKTGNAEFSPQIPDSNSNVESFESNITNIVANGQIPPAGAVSIVLPATEWDLSNVKETYLNIDFNGRLDVYLISNDPNFQGSGVLNMAGGSYKQFADYLYQAAGDSEGYEIVYNAMTNNTVPEMFLILVNPSVIEPTTGVEVKLGVRNTTEFNVDVTATVVINVIEPPVTDAEEGNMGCGNESGIPTPPGTTETYTESWRFDLEANKVYIAGNADNDTYEYPADYDPEADTILGLEYFPRTLSMTTENVSYYHEGYYRIELTYDPTLSGSYDDGTRVYVGDVREVNTTSWSLDSRTVTCYTDYRLEAKARPAE